MIRDSLKTLIYICLIPIVMQVDAMIQNKIHTQRPS